MIWVCRLRPLDARRGRLYKRSQFGGVNCAKRTQFATRHAGTSGTDRAKQSQFPAAPDGTRPGGRGPRGQVRKTKPIPGRAWATRAVEGNRAKQSQFGPRCPEMGARRQVWGPCRGRLCKTKPILEGVSSFECQVRQDGLRVLGVFLLRTSHFELPAERRLPRGNRAKQTQFARSEVKDKSRLGKELWLIGHAKSLGKTKPICARAATANGRQGGRRRRSGRACETNPIWRWSPPRSRFLRHDGARSRAPDAQPTKRRRGPRASVRNKANSCGVDRRGTGGRSNQCCRRWGQACETKPICLGAVRRASAVRKRSYNRLDPRMAPAKQSQFPGGAGCINKPNLPPTGREDQPQGPALSAANGPEAVTLPPARRRTCETKPIWGEVSTVQCQVLSPPSPARQSAAVCRSHPRDSRGKNGG